MLTGFTLQSRISYELESWASTALGTLILPMKLKIYPNPALPVG